jgi:DNA-binding LacI/PurR family transcriptional regulator
MEAYDRFFDLAGQFKLALRENWIHAIRAYDVSGQQSTERYGYERFKALWQTTPHPDGLIVNDDVAARGVITALLEARVRVPEDLRLVLHRNREIDLVCPFPATFVESSAQDMGRVLVEQIKKQYQGEPCEREPLPFKLVSEVETS